MKNISVLAILLAFVSCSGGKILPAMLTSFSGSVSLNGKMISAPGEKIAFGDQIETGAKSFCIIKIGERNILKLNQNSKLVYNISTSGNSLELKQGWLAGVTKQKFTKDGLYHISTPAVSAAVRGTSFCLKVEDPKNTYFCVCNGAIELKGAGTAKGELIESAHHAAARYSLGDDGSTVVDKNAGLLYHDDAGLSSLAAEIGVVIDWTKPDSHK